MSLLELSLSGFRCFEKTKIQFHPDCNILVGQNASGKTSFVESLHVLSLGRSFRSVSLDKVVADAKSGFSISAELLDNDSVRRRCTIKRARSYKTELTIDGQQESSVSALGQIMQVQVISHEGFLFFDGPPLNRRRFIDYGSFHVKQNFINDWRRYKKILQQRNALLRRLKHYDNQFSSWDSELVQLASNLDTYRSNYWSLFESYFNRFSKLLDFGEEVSLDYQRGWKRDKALDELMRDNFKQDQRLGYTQSGPHKFDLRIRIGTKPAKECLSRGQQKLLFYVMILSQVHLLYDMSRRKVVLAIDDFTAEVDQKSQDVMMKILALADQKVQFFITSLDESLPSRLQDSDIFSDGAKTFHVKQGNIQALNYS